MLRWHLVAVVSLSLVLLTGLAESARTDPASIEIDTSCKYPNSIYYADTLKVIWKPLATLPALVRPGDTLTVWANAPSGSTTWSATLRLAALNVPLAGAGGAYQTTLGRWVLSFLVPQGTKEELYDLVLSSSTGLQDTTRHCVKVLPSFRSDYYFAQITDTHLPEHTMSSSGSFSTCDTTGMADFDAVIADLNLIHPEFILHTGDLVNEGELDTLYQMNEMGRALQMVYRLRDPMFLVSGNHDIGGWSSTPVPAGTSRRDWWRFFGWTYLMSPPSGDPYHSQDYTFDYDSLRVIALEGYLNYDGWMSSIWGAGSFTTEQMNWLTQTIAAAGSKHKLLMYHFDFDQGANTGSTSGPWQLNYSTLGVDGGIWGHDHTVPENTVTARTAHPFNLGLQSVISNRTFRIFRVHNGNITPGPMHHAGSTTDSLSASWSAPNDGSQVRLSVTVTNRFGESWDHSRLVFTMVDHDSNYAATGGTVAQTIRQGGVMQVYVDCTLPASGSATVSVAPSTPITAGVGGPEVVGFALERPSPNPFVADGGKVTLRYALPSAGAVRVAVYDLEGRRVAALLAAQVGPGEHSLTWDGRTESGQTAPAGVYLIRLEGPVGVRSQKLLLVH